MSDRAIHPNAVTTASQHHSNEKTFVCFFFILAFQLD